MYLQIKQLYQKYSHLLASASPLGSSIELPRNLSQSTSIILYFILKITLLIC